VARLWPRSDVCAIRHAPPPLAHATSRQHDTDDLAGKTASARWGVPGRVRDGSGMNTETEARRREAKRSETKRNLLSLAAA
jgi:hypothetical protein